MSADAGTANPLRAKLAAGECATCFMVTMPSVAMAQLLAASSADALIIDMEHGPIDLPTAHAMIAASKGTPAVPIVRVPWYEPWLAKPVLDAGAYGINFPMISTAALARESVSAVRYPPAGARGYAPSYAPTRWGLSTEEYLRAADREVMNLITIEEPAAIEALDEILAVPGIDVVVIASFDLSMAMGIPGRFDDPELLRLIAGAETKIRAAGLPMGGVALSAEAARAKRAAGYQLLLVGFDVLMVDAAARAALGFHSDASPP